MKADKKQKFMGGCVFEAQGPINDHGAWDAHRINGLQIRFRGYIPHLSELYAYPGAKLMLGVLMLTASASAIDRKDFEFLTEANSRQWLDAVLMQGERCVTAVNALRFAGCIEQLHHASDMMRIEEHFFVIALGKAMEWLAELAKQRDELRPAIEGYLAQMPHARDVRNMREHDVAYFMGEGQRQSCFVHQHTDSDGQVLALADGSSTAVFGEHYRIGGRLDLNFVVRISQELRLVLGRQNVFASA